MFYLTFFCGVLWLPFHRKWLIWYLVGHNTTQKPAQRTLGSTIQPVSVQHIHHQPSDLLRRWIWSSKLETFRHRTKFSSHDTMRCVTLKISAGVSEFQLSRKVQFGQIPKGITFMQYSLQRKNGFTCPLDVYTRSTETSILCQLHHNPMVWFVVVMKLRKTYNKGWFPK